MDASPQKPNAPKVDKWRAMNLAFEFGYIIALPLVILGLIGKYLDQKYGSEPWLTLAGIALAIGLTTFWLTRRIKEYITKT